MTKVRYNTKNITLCNKAKICLSTIYVIDGGEGLENAFNCQCKVGDLKSNIDTLTDGVIIQLNKINRLLIELEQCRQNCIASSN